MKIAEIVIIFIITAGLCGADDGPRPAFPQYFESRGVGYCTGTGTFSCPSGQAENATFDFHQWWEFDADSGFMVREREDDLLQPGPIVYGRSYLNFTRTTGSLTVMMLFDNSSHLECESFSVVASPINRFYLLNATFLGFFTIPSGELCYEYENYFNSSAGSVDWVTYVSVDTKSVVGIKSVAQKFEEYYSWTQGYDYPFDESIWQTPEC